MKRLDRDQAHLDRPRVTACMMNDVVRRMEIRRQVQAEAAAADRLRLHVPCPVLQARLALVAAHVREIARMFLDRVEDRSEQQERLWLNGAEMELDLRAEDLDALARLAAQQSCEM